MELSTLSAIITFGTLFLVGVIFYQNIKIHALTESLKHASMVEKLALSKYQLIRAATAAKKGEE
jgi:hypothetical protein